ncbi:hypothetical protein EVAR_93986_1 [Eumeta japonica]|uniref:Uncharacterized protein n=1 Tax=Eumeta variegata TaxID=151549 RepID=A0A4C1TPA5_EUMVA|nr:hypothetical protein EVAR_93986_1 [Eumeta japonica]
MIHSHSDRDNSKMKQNYNFLDVRGILAAIKDYAHFVRNRCGAQCSRLSRISFDMPMQAPLAAGRGGAAPAPGHAIAPFRLVRHHSPIAFLSLDSERSTPGDRQAA